jgi:hypothetical protein
MELTRTEQQEFVRQLCMAMAKRIVTEIEDGRIPATWEGYELRWLIADRAQNNTFEDTPKRRREYLNYCRVHNL